MGRDESRAQLCDPTVDPARPTQYSCSLATSAGSRGTRWRLRATAKATKWHATERDTFPASDVGSRDKPQFATGAPTTPVAARCPPHTCLVCGKGEDQPQKGVDQVRSDFSTRGLILEVLTGSSGEEAHPVQTC